MNSFNLKFLEEISAGDQDKLQRLVTTFLEEAPKAFEQIQGSFRDKKYDDLNRAAHTVKPLYLSIGAEKASFVIKNIEEYSRSAFFRELIPVEIQELGKINDSLFREMNALIHNQP